MKAVKKPLVMPGAAGSSQGNLGRCRVRHGGVGCISQDGGTT